MSLLSVICEIIQSGVAVSALLLEVSERIGKKKGKDDREKFSHLALAGHSGHPQSRAHGQAEILRGAAMCFRGAVTFVRSNQYAFI